MYTLRESTISFFFKSGAMPLRQTRSSISHSIPRILYCSVYRAYSTKALALQAQCTTRGPGVALAKSAATGHPHTPFLGSFFQTLVQHKWDTLVARMGPHLRVYHTGSYCTGIVFVVVSIYIRPLTHLDSPWRTCAISTSRANWLPRANLVDRSIQNVRVCAFMVGKSRTARVYGTCQVDMSASTYHGTGQWIKTQQIQSLLDMFLCCWLLVCRPRKSVINTTPGTTVYDHRCTIILDEAKAGGNDSRTRRLTIHRARGANTAAIPQGT